MNWSSVYVLIFVFYPSDASFGQGTILEAEVFQEAKVGTDMMYNVFFFTGNLALSILFIILHFPFPSRQ